MRTSELARRAGVNVQTIRFYERRQLLREPPRTPSGYRRYDEQDLEHVAFIKRCQYLGFTLKEITVLSQLHSSILENRDGEGRTKFERFAAIAKDRLATLEEKIANLQQMRDQLQEMCSNILRPDSSVCPVKKSRAKR